MICKHYAIDWGYGGRAPEGHKNPLIFNGLMSSEFDIPESVNNSSEFKMNCWLRKLA
jgi:hypothetical protein